MLKRIPEPELMLDRAQARAYADADFEQAHQSFVSHLRRCLPDLPAEAAALDLGCGPADVTRRVALSYPGWRIDAIDGSPAMLDIGRSVLKEAGLSERVTLHEARLPACPLPRNRYDVVLSNSLLHHLHSPDTLWQAVRDYATPGGSVFAMDLSRPKNTSALNALLDTAQSEPEVLRRDFHNSLLAAYTVKEVEEQLKRNGLGHLRVAHPSDRHWIAWGKL